jgi:Type I restriction modification DNA specificity domain
MREVMLCNGWKAVKLREVASVGSGDPAPQDLKYFDGGTYPFIRTQDVGRNSQTRELTETIDKINDHATS